MKSILLIDDDHEVRVTYAFVLRRAGYKVIEADSGAVGLALARQHLPDLILSDIHMPGGDGSSLLHAVRRDPALRSKQVVLMTGRPDLVTPRKGMEDGADDFLVKPIPLKALLSCVEARFSRASISWRVEDQMLSRLRSSVPAQLPHEFFTPLAGIIGLLEILRASYPGLPPAEVQDIHADIYQSALRLHRTLRNYLLILDLQDAPPPAAVPPLPPAKVEAAIQAGVKEALRLNPRGADVTVRVEACTIPVRPDDLTLMTEELLDNACKFSRPGTPVLAALGADGRFTVADQGRGLSEEEIGRIGAFQQFDRHKHEQQGLGLGLVLVQKLAAQYQAEFSLESTPGEKTEARIAFPLAGNGKVAP
jgi:signal transduction histidine kinase